MKILICSDLTLGLLTQILIKRLRADLGLDTNIYHEKSPNMFPEIDDFFPEYLEIFF